MSAKMTPAKRFMVRIALVTSSTLATIMGAQSLASLDEANFAQSAPNSAIDELNNQPTHPTVSTNAASAAPNIVILRRGDGQSSLATQSQSSVIGEQAGLPNSAAILPPVSQAVEPVTRSSR